VNNVVKELLNLDKKFGNMNAKDHVKLLPK